MLERVAFASNAFTGGGWRFEDVIYVLAGCGYRAVNFLADAPLFWPLELSKYRRRTVESALKKTGLVISGVNGFTAAGHYGKRTAPPGQDFGPSFADLDPELRAWKVHYTKQVIDLTEQLGARNISISSGYPPEDTDPEDAWKRMIEAIQEVLAYAEPKGSNLNIEFEPRLLISGSDDAARLLQALPSPNLGVNFDIGHSFVCKEDVVAQILHFGSKINGADIEDIGLRNGEPYHFHLVPGEGVMPLKDIFRAFQECGFEKDEENWYTVELYSQSHRPIEAARESMEYLRRLEEQLQKIG